MFFCIDKAAGVTTRLGVKKLLQVKGRGFGVEGILDPFASGLLIAATGDSTRFLSYFLQFQKTYIAEVTLGIETDTLDNTGDIQRREPVLPISDVALQAVAAQFTGTFDQMPPLYSNLKFEGKRSHELARAGKTAYLKTRKVTVQEIQLIQNTATTLTMRCTVSSGTYIRALARDIAAALGTCGHLSALRRVRIGDHALPDAAPVTDAEGLIVATMTDFEALPFFEIVQIAETDRLRFLRGVPLTLDYIKSAPGIKRVLVGETFIGLAAWSGVKLTVEKIYPNPPGVGA